MGEITRSAECGSDTGVLTQLFLNRAEGRGQAVTVAGGERLITYSRGLAAVTIRNRPASDSVRQSGLGKLAAVSVFDGAD